MKFVLLLLSIFYLLSRRLFVKIQVVYGRSMSDEFDRQGLSAMIDYWISPAAVKREFEATKSKHLAWLACDLACDQSHPF